jgi:hypothetical protein
VRLTRLVYASVVLLTAVHPGSCGNNCDFWQRCQGDILQTCGYADQCFNRGVRDEPCESPNAACVQVGDSAFCARDPLSRCDGASARRCQGNLLIECSGSVDGYELATDCAETGRSCVSGGSSGAACQAR